MEDGTTKAIDAKDPRLVEAKELVTAAAAILNKLGPEMQRVSWLLEDSLMYIDEAIAVAQEGEIKDLSFLDFEEENTTEEKESAEAAR